MKRIYSITVILLFGFNTFLIFPLPGIQSEGWSNDIRLTFTNSRSTIPAIAVDGNYIHVVYADNESGGKDDMFLWYTNSNDGGNTWISPICLIGKPPREISGPKIAVNGSNIHVIWLDLSDKRVHYIRSVDNGDSWSKETALTTVADRSYRNWNIDEYGNNLHIVYIDSNYKLSYVQSNDNGITWSSPKILIPTNSKALHSDIAVNGSTVHIAWWDITRGGKFTTEIFYIKSEDNGLTWEEDINVTRTPMKGKQYVDIAIDINDIYVVYTQKVETIKQVHFSYSEDNGDTWVRTIKLSNSTENTFRPIITVQSEDIFVFWEDHRTKSLDVFYKHSSDNGKTWSPDTRITYGYYSHFADAASTKEAVHLVWVDRRDGNEEIYYKQYLTPEQFIEAKVDVDPDTLNLKSKGRWITAYIELEEGHDVNDINLSTILLENSVPLEYHPTEIGDYDNDGIPDLMVKFDRSDVEDMLTPSESVTLKITGSLKTGEGFEGGDDFRVIRPP